METLNPTHSLIMWLGGTVVRVLDLLLGFHSTWGHCVRGRMRGMATTSRVSRSLRGSETGMEDWGTGIINSHFST